MVDAAAWYDLGWSNWVGLVIGIVGVPLTLVGLRLTWNQAKDAKDAAQAAQTAVRRTQAQLRANQLLVLVPQLRWIAAELDLAIQEPNGSLAKRHLDNWRWQAGHVHGILNSADASQRRLLKSLQDSVSLCATAGSALLGKNNNRSVLQICARARESIGEVCDQLGRWVGERTMNLPEEDADATP